VIASIKMAQLMLAVFYSAMLFVENGGRIKCNPGLR
jgi:hypothetical protein